MSAASLIPILGAVKLSPTQLGLVKAAREKLTAALAGGETVRRRIAALQARLDQIDQELEGHVDPLDFARIEKRRAMETQATAIREELETLDADALTPPTVKANAQAIVLIRQILQPELERLVGRATAAFRPFFTNDPGAVQAAQQCEIVRNFGGCLNCPYETDPTPDTVGETMRWLDELAAGVNPWLKLR